MHGSPIKKPDRRAGQKVRTRRRDLGGDGAAVFCELLLKEVEEAIGGASAGAFQLRAEGYVSVADALVRGVLRDSGSKAPGIAPAGG